MQLHNKYHDDGLVILAFPCNQFGRQEPWPNAEIKKFVTEKYNVQFSMFSKVDVNGNNADPIFKALKKHFLKSSDGDMRGNFNKFLLDRTGIPVSHFPKKQPPLSFEDKIVELLKQT